MTTATITQVKKRLPLAGKVTPTLGVGVTYQPKMKRFIEQNLNLLDFIEVVPDMLWSDPATSTQANYTDNADGIAWLKNISNRLPVVLHSIGLSIGSAHRFKHEHVKQLARWHQWLNFPWHSDHLAYNLAEHDGVEVNVGITMPVTQDERALAMLVPRIREIQSTINVPFALENNVYFFAPDEQEMEDAEFLNHLMHQSGCYLILDLHNLFTNAQNHGTDPYSFLDRLDLSRVIEVHVAGGMEVDNFYLDAHSGPTPEPVLDLLRYALPHCSNLGGINFEILGSWYEKLGDTCIQQELAKLKHIWHQYRPQQLQQVANS